MDAKIKTGLRYFAQGSRMLLGFLIVFLAKKNGTLLSVGKLLNISVIYSMVTSSALMPFMQKLWKSYQPISVLKSVVIYCSIALVIPLCLIGHRDYLILLTIAMLVFVLSTLLMQFLQDLSEAYESMVIGLQVLANTVTIFMILFGLDLVVAYFLPHFFLLVFGLWKFRYQESGVILSINTSLGILKSMVGLSIILSLSWPLCFYALREFYGSVNPLLWEDVEFILRICLSILGLNSSVILHYNWGLSSSNISDIRHNVVRQILLSIPLLILGYVFAVSFTKSLSEFTIIGILIGYSIKVITLIPSYILMNRNMLPLVLSCELIGNVVLFCLFTANMNIGYLIPLISLTQFLIIQRNCRRVFS